MVLFIALFAIVTLGAGVVLAFFPEEIRARELKWYAEQRNRILRWNPWLPLMKTGAYIVVIRLAGVISLTMAAIAIYALVRKILGA